MAAKYLQLLLTASVQQAEDRYFGRHHVVTDAPAVDSLTPEEEEFIAARDTFYLASVSETGWPYVQHRGGAPGFLKVLSPTRLGFADYRGNRQLITTGNVAADDRVALFLMDYASRNRLKLLGHARVLDAREDPALAAELTVPGFQGKVERLFLIDVVSWDWNCSQYIVPRFTAAELEQVTAPLKARIAVLEAQLRSQSIA